MRRFVLLLIGLTLSITVSAQQNPNEKNRTLWKFSQKAAGDFASTGVYGSVKGIDSEIRFVPNKKKSGATFSVEKGQPVVERTSCGDAFVFTMPVRDLAAGTVVDFWVAYNAEPAETPRYYMLEYLDGGKWLPALEIKKDLDGTPYNTLSTAKKKIPRREWITVRIEKAIKNGAVAFRLRQTDKRVGKTTLYGGATGQSPRIVCYEAIVPQDTTRFLFLGNSYTYFNLYPDIFKEIAWREGHYADCTMFVSGGYKMEDHLKNPISRETVELGGYDVAMVQDQSVTPLMNGTEDDFGQKEYLAEMKQYIEKYSPNARQFLEITWGRKDGDNKLGKYEILKERHPEWFVSYEAYQARLTEQLTTAANEAGMELNPLGVAWRIVRQERPDIDLYYKDAHHPSYAGSYLSAAVAYLAVYRQPFGDNPANGSLKAETAAYLRSVAEQVVLENRK